MSEKEKEVEKEEASKTPINHSKKMKFGDKECTVLQYAGMTSISSRLKFWIKMKYDNKETRTANEWYKELVKEKAINERPAILDQMVTGSK